jgi:hypothetical protein
MTSSNKYCDDILAKLYSVDSKTSMEIGYETRGHNCIKDTDKTKATKEKASLLYGEITPDGLRVLLDEKHCNISRGQKVFDLGMGTAKVAIQIFLDHPELSEVVGVELSDSRYSIAEASALQLVRMYSTYTIKKYLLGKHLIITNNVTGCILRLSCDNLFNELNYTEADIIVFDTDIPKTEMLRLGVHFSKLKKTCKVISFNNFQEDPWDLYFPYFKQMDINRNNADVFRTSWSAKGWKFFIWETQIIDVNWDKYFEEIKEQVEVQAITSNNNNNNNNNKKVEQYNHPSYYKNDEFDEFYSKFDKGILQTMASYVF